MASKAKPDNFSPLITETQCVQVDERIAPQLHQLVRLNKCYIRETHVIGDHNFAYIIDGQVS